MIENEYIWLDLVGDISNQTLAKLKAIYIDEYRIYLATFCPEKFREVLIENNILVLKSTFRNMISLEFKIYSIKIAQVMKKENMEVIGLLQKEYPQSLRKYGKCPTAIYLKAKTMDKCIGVLKLRERFTNMYKLYMLEGRNQFNKEILEYIWPKSIYKSKRKYLASNIIINSGDVRNIQIQSEEYMLVCIAGDIEIYVLKRDDIHIDKGRLLFGIIDGLVIARVNNIEKGIDIVDFALEEGIDVFAVPGNILYRENYLANHVIKQGAYVVTNRYDMENLI